MANQLSSQDYVDMVLHYAKRKSGLGLLFNSSFSSEDIVAYCIKRTKELDPNDEKAIRSIVKNTLMLMKDGGYVKQCGSRFKVIASLDDIDMILEPNIPVMKTTKEQAEALNKIDISHNGYSL